jgi:23S rRNA (pseudouridine1915-N3)-methyltransferase
MNFRIVCVGSAKEKYLKDAESEYFKRLKPFGNIVVTEVKEAFASGKGGAAGAAAEKEAVEREGESILKILNKVNHNNSYVVVLDGNGKDLSSEQFAEKISRLAVSGTSTIVFVIGGSCGLSDAVRAAADFTLSFGNKTWPHRLMRVLLAEQIYRACKINAGETYHK